MNKTKTFGGVLVAAAVVLYKFQLVLSKLGSMLKLGAVVLVLLHLRPAADSTVLAARTAHGPKAAGQSTKPNVNRAEKIAGPSATPPAGGPAMMPSAPLGAGAINAARNAAAAQNAQLAKETGQAVPTPPGARPTAPPPQAPTVASAPAMQQGAPKPVAVSKAPPAHAAADTSADVMRETFDYTRDSRRDPFVSLMTTSDLRPTLSDLRLTGILYDLSGRRPVAILRDIAGGQWRVTTGMTLGRMRVAQIKPKTIIFTIEEFGFNRQDSLVLGDTTRVRHR
jgi:hypothetical protein